MNALSRARIVAAIAALLFALFALLAALVNGFAAPEWVLPLAVTLACAVVAIP